MKSKTLHLIQDDWFIDYAIDFFNSIDQLDNDYVLLEKFTKPDDKLRHKALQNLFNKGIRSIEYGSEAYTSFIKEASDTYQNVIVHFLTDEKAHFINRITVKNLIWIVWGGDAYNHPKLLLDMYDKETLKLLGAPSLFVANKKLYRSYYLFRSSVEYIKYFLDNKEQHPRQEYEKAIKRFNTCLTLTDSEEKVLRKILPKNVSFKSFSYGSLEDHIQGVPDISTTLAVKKNILLGNSSTPSNNHVDILNQLSKLDLEDRQVIVPLSYGDPIYGKKIIEIGKKLLGDNFYPLVEYMPKSEYNRFISSCGIVIMNHKRQQGLGNIFSQLWMGAKVFLNPASPVFQDFTLNGLTIFSSLEIDKEAIVFNGPYNSEETLLNLFGRKNIAQRVQDLQQIL